jgi:PAS domain S-box-containing protein
VSGELEGIAARFDDLRVRIGEVAGDDEALAGMVAELRAAVEEQTAVFGQILDHLPIGIAVVDPSLRMVRFNRRARAITGRVLESTTPIDGWTDEIFQLDGSQMTFEERPSVRSLHGETLQDLVFEIRNPERGSYVVETSTAPIRDASGEVILAVSVFDDVTQGYRRAKADRDFVANAAHQIRGPIVAMTSAFGALGAGAKDDPEARERFLDHIEREVARMRGLADALLTLARAERGDQSAPLLPIALRPLLQRTIDRSAPKKGVSFELSCPEHLNALTNEALMSEALANVVTNAVQHTQRGTVALRGLAGPDGPSIEICDEGPGIVAGDRDRIFERFFRGSPPAAAGVGLGLAVAASATQAAGGVLELVDSPVGACFRFTLLRAPFER